MTRFEKIKNMSVADFFNMVVQKEITVNDVSLIYSFHNKGDGKNRCTNCIAKDCCKTINGGCLKAMEYALNSEWVDTIKERF